MIVDVNTDEGYEVAVKYLKLKDKPGDKVAHLKADFEYETNLMKELNHRYIVKLLA